MNELSSGKRLAVRMNPDRNVLEMFESTINTIDPTSQGRAAQIAELRRRMDLACDAGHITIREWRTLLDKVAAI